MNERIPREEISAFIIILNRGHFNNNHNKTSTSFEQGDRNENDKILKTRFLSFPFLPQVEGDDIKSRLSQVSPLQPGQRNQLLISCPPPTALVMLPSCCGCSLMQNPPL